MLPLEIGFSRQMVAPEPVLKACAVRNFCALYFALLNSIILKFRSGGYRLIIQGCFICKRLQPRR